MNSKTFMYGVSSRTAGELVRTQCLVDRSGRPFLGSQVRIPKARGDPRMLAFRNLSSGRV